MYFNDYKEHISFEMRDSSEMSQRVLEDDELTVKGTYAGVESSFCFGEDYVKISVEEVVINNASSYSEKDITYERLLRYPEKYKGTKLEYTGTVSGVNYSSDGSLTFDMYFNDYKEHISFEMRDSSGMSQRVLEDDELTVKGTYAGVETSFGFGEDYVVVEVTKIK